MLIPARRAVLFLLFLGTLAWPGSRVLHASQDTGIAPADSSRVRVELIARAIRDHIESVSQENGGRYRLLHDGTWLELELVRVHMEYLSDLGGGRLFACVDLADAGGTVYDVDFFLQQERGIQVVTESSVHKLNGQPLYAWEQQSDETWQRVAVEAAPDRLLGLVTGSDEFEFVYRVDLPQLAGEAQVWIPLAPTDSSQRVEILGITSPVPGREIVESSYGNRVLHLTAGPAESGKRIEILYRVRRTELSPYLSSDPSGDSMRESIPIAGADSLRTIAQEVTRDTSSDLMRARALYDHVIDRLHYARYGSGWGVGDAVNACDTGSGNCTDFHAYFIALARSIGIPARFAIGASIPSERDTGGIDGYHCWAEFLAEGKWWPVDISEADKYTRLSSYYFGHLPANRFELSRGRDLVVEPGPSGGPINFLAYPVIEVAGEPATATTEFYFRRLGTMEGS